MTSTPASPVTTVSAVIPVLHVLTGAGLRGLATPDARQLSQELGPEIQPATAFWISPRCGHSTHDFLGHGGEGGADAEGGGSRDGRIALFAEAILRDFGRRKAPLIVAPDLGAESADPAIRDWPSVLAELQADLSRMAEEEAPPFRLRAFACPPLLSADEARAELDRIAAGLAEGGVRAVVVADAVALPAPLSPLRQHLMRNQTAGRLMAEVIAQGRDQGLEIADPRRLRAHCDRYLEQWATIGLRPDPADPAALARLAGRLLKDFAQEAGSRR